MDRLTFILYIQGNSFTIQRKSPIKIVALPPPLDRFTTLFLDLAGLNINYGEYQRMTPSKFWAGSGPNRPSFLTKKRFFSVFWGYLYIKPSPWYAPIFIFTFRPFPSKNKNLKIKISSKLSSLPKVFGFWKISNEKWNLKVFNWIFRENFDF